MLMFIGKLLRRGTLLFLLLKSRRASAGCL